MFAAEKKNINCWLWDPAVEQTLRLTGWAALEGKSHLCQWDWNSNVICTWDLQIASVEQLGVTGWTSKMMIFTAQWVKSLFSSGSMSLWSFLRFHPWTPLQDFSFWQSRTAHTWLWLDKGRSPGWHQTNGSIYLTVSHLLCSEIKWRRAGKVCNVKLFLKKKEKVKVCYVG